MTLSNQTIANRENAKQSTGPTTEQGKETASQNATTFGLHSNKLIINSKYHTEDRVSYDLLVEDLRSELKPTTCFQEFLIRKIANCLWRSQRAAIAETAHINKQLNEIDDKIETEQFFHADKMRKDKNLEPIDFESATSQELSNLIGIHSLPNTDYAKKILYYEMRLDRQLARNYDLLRKLQYKEKSDKMEKQKKIKNTQNEPILL